MVQAYNFLGSWQLFPEKGNYEWGTRPKSGIYQIEAIDNRKAIRIHQSWVTLENESFVSDYLVEADGEIHPSENVELAHEVQVHFIDTVNMELHFYKNSQTFLHITHEILPNGFLKITQQGTHSNGEGYTNTEVFHKQMSVLPYGASAAGAIVKATEEGVIRHKALTAMEEQTHMQLEQIRKQIELLAQQAQEIHQRKELSKLIYSAKLSFKPEIGQVYYLYEKNDNTHTLSLISPTEWGAGMPYKKFVAAVQLLADHTWKERPL